MLPLQRAILHSIRDEILPKFLLHHRFVIGPVVDVYLRNGFAFKGDDVSADAVEEPAVMRDDVCYLIQRSILHAIVAESALLTEINSSSSIIDDEHGVIKDYQ